MSEYPRFLRRAVEESLSDTPVVIIQGARQVGKSTLAQMVGHDRPDVLRLTLDDPLAMAAAEADPMGFLQQAGDGLLIIDEAQRSPGLILPLKAAVDENRRPGRFLLTGSADLLSVAGVGDSLAGRAETIELWPLSQGEIQRRSQPEDFVASVLTGHPLGSGKSLDIEVVLRGGFPEPLARPERRAHSWFRNYVDRLAQHDARDLTQGGYPEHLRQLVKIAAAQGSSELVKAKWARELNVAESTLAEYLRLLSVMRLSIELPPWGRNLRGRVVGRPKVSLIDCGLSASLMGITAQKSRQLGTQEYRGSLVEQFVVAELSKQRGWSEVEFDLFHYRESSGAEVDIVVECSDGSLIAIEVKSGLTVTHSAWKSLNDFRTRFSDRTVHCVVLYGGDRSQRINSDLHVLPLTSLWA